MACAAAGEWGERPHERAAVLRWLPAWLGENAETAAALLRPAPDDVLRAWPVSRAVNDVRRDGPELPEPAE
jgi:putative SOS response-associated peptidase YedK